MPTRIVDAANSVALESSPHALLPFLQSQSQNTLTRLYQRPSSCLSIFRSITIVFRYLCVSDYSIQAAGSIREANCDESSLAGVLYSRYNNGSMGYPRSQKVLLLNLPSPEVQSLSVSIDSMIMH